MTPAQAKRDRAELLRAVRLEEKRKDRAKLVKLRARARELRRARAAAIVEARRACAARRRAVPTLREAAAMLRAARAEARATCDAGLAKARAIKSEAARAKAERDAERAHQRTMRRLERHAKERAAGVGPRLAKARAVRRSESDDEVRGNIPPELVYLFERIKRQIKGSDRRTRTEEFLEYAESHPDEELAAIEDRTDALIAELEARERRANGPPARAWWDDCIARVEAAARASGRPVREPRAVCGAAWWRLPPSKRAAIVHRLEGAKDARARGAALALARLERAHARGRRSCAAPERRPNPPREVVSLVYLEQKPGDREPYEYEHAFEGERPRLEMRGGKAQLRGGSYGTRGGWLVG